jgi:hypothetical protein
MSNYEIEEGDRQLILLALAKLSLSRPGWHPACTSRVAKIFRGLEMYEEFRAHGHDPHPSLLMGGTAKPVGGPIMVMPNLNVCAFCAEGQQIPELNKSVPLLLAEHMLRCGYDPEGVVIESANGNWKLRRTDEGWIRDKAE